MDKQIFQTESKSRWSRFKWTLRVLAVILILLIAVFLTMLALEGSPKMPLVRDYRHVMTAEKPLMKKNAMARQYKSFRDFFKEKTMHNDYAAEAMKKHRFHVKGDKATSRYLDEWDDPSKGIRAAWYVNWDPRSYQSLKRNLKHLNMVIPEWFFIDPKTDALKFDIDKKALALLRKSGTPILPMLTNNFGASFQAAPIGRIMNSPKKRAHLINQLLRACLKYHFAGINLDLEELQIDDNDNLTALVQELAKVFHDNGLFVTQDIAPFNEDYDVVRLANYDDYLFLMAYDEHNAQSTPGSICSQQWVEKAMDEAARAIPSNKIVLGLAAYGYDWTPGDGGTTVSFDQAMASASDAGSDINYDEDTYNLNFSYEDDDNHLHQVYFTDAATLFNMMRFGCEYPVAGFGLWRLGTEDERFWKFYDRNMTRAQTEHYPFHNLEKIPGLYDIDYMGDGEVLNVRSEPQPGKAKLSIDRQSMLIASEDYLQIPESYEIDKIGHAKEKDLVLTFDDGPDYRWTPTVLRILDRYHVKAAFFMVGLQMEKNLPLVKKVYEAGHTIGNHTFTHHNLAENSENRTFMELKLTRMLLESITGQSTILFRAPYNADSDPSGRDEIEPMVLAARRNYMFVGESVDPNDWEPGISAQQIYDRVIKGVHQENGHIILLHDAGGSTRKPTLAALPRIIHELQKEGYHFISLEQYLGKTRDQLMPPIAKGKTYYAMQANLALATLIYEAGDFVTALLIIFLILGLMRLVFMYILTIREKREEHRRHYPEIDPLTAPLVSIIVPAYNEEVNIVATLKNLRKQDYPNFNVVFVDDGSKDHTLDRVKENFQEDTGLVILHKSNAGKASALNYGIDHTTAEYVVCIDADTRLQHDAVSIMMKHLIADSGKKVGAVAGNVKVGNPRNILTLWQAIEYTTSQNFDRMAYSNINAITVVPGAIGTFRRQAIIDAGGLTTDTLAEDCDLTMRIIDAGYVIENENKAVALTEAPETLRQFVKQRTRWCFGVMQTFWKHRSALFSKKHKGLGLWALPNMLVFQYIIPTFSPLADLLMIVGIFAGNFWQIFIYYLLFLAVDASVSVMAFLFEHERISTLLWIIPQRFFYRWIMYYVIFKSYLKAIKGELQAWGVLKRTGNVKVE